MKIDPESLYLQLGQLVTAMPDLMAENWAVPDVQLWLGRASALVEASGNFGDIAGFNVATQNLGSSIHAQHVQAITAIIYRSLARAELAAPAALRGQFIAAGDTLSAFAAVSKVFERAKRDLLLIDGYADHTIITDFAVTAPDGVNVRILAADKEARKQVMRPAVERWAKQFEASRQLSVRVAPAATLHDRLIFVDMNEVWVLGQSFNGIAQRSHTSLVRTDTDLAAQKLAAYDAIWNDAKPL